MKLWLKIYSDDRITFNGVFSNDAIFNRENYESYIMEIFYQLDIACPLQLGVHFRHIDNFNLAKYNRMEFCEEVKFDYITVENIQGQKI